MPYTKGSYESSKKYKEKNIKRIPLDVQIELYESLKQVAEKNGETVNGFIKTAIAERMEKLNRDTAIPDSFGTETRSEENR